MSTDKPYICDVSDDEWSFVVPFLTLMAEDSHQSENFLREAFSGLRLPSCGYPWCYLPNELIPSKLWMARPMHWIRAGYLPAIVKDLRELLRVS